jgi:glycosyltransferase involved in cell wall biosynthesis
MQFSVIIPTYNRASTLPRALDSVLTQTHPADEIIVVDDGSDDETSTLISENYPQIRYLYQSNQGVSSARNTGIAGAKSEWIALLDSDDAWLPEKLERQRDSLITHPRLHICHTEEIWIRNGIRVNPMRKHAKQGGRIFQRCLPLCVISPSSVVLHRSLFEKYGDFDSSLPACEDYELWLRLCAHEEVQFLEQPLVVKYGGHEDQLSKKHWGMDRFRIQALEKAITGGSLSTEDLAASIGTLLEKSAIMEQGARKRGRHRDADHYHDLQHHYQTLLTAIDGATDSS